jgi:hypothetical protein
MRRLKVEAQKINPIKVSISLSWEFAAEACAS